MTEERAASFGSASPRSRPAIPISLGISCLGLAGYIMIHSIPGTGALRSLFLLLIVAGLTTHSWLARPALRWPRLDMAGKTLLLLTLWLTFQSSFLAIDGPASLNTFANEWTKNLLLAAIGIWLARAALFAESGRWVFAAVFGGYFAHVLGTIGFQAWYLLTHGKFYLFMSLLGNYGYVSPMLDGAIAIAFADAASRFCVSRPLLPVSDRGLGLIFFLSLLTLLVLSPKASLINALLMVGLFATVAAINFRHHRKQIVAIALAATVGFAAVGVLIQGRWNGALESIRFGMAIDEHTIWKGGGETLPSYIDESFYLRAAWGVAGLRGLAEHPLGRGYGSNAFGRYLAEKYGIQGAVSSHSGWLDFALANGIPGLMLLLALSAALCVRGWRSFVNNTGIGGLALTFMTVAYIFRCLFDGQISTSKLMAFALVSGIVWGLTWDADPPRESRSA